MSEREREREREREGERSCSFFVCVRKNGEENNRRQYSF